MMTESEMIIRTLENQHQELLELEFFKMAGELSKIKQTLGDSLGMSKENCISVLRAFDEPLDEFNHFIDIFRKHMKEHYPKDYQNCFGDGLAYQRFKELRLEFDKKVMAYPQDGDQMKGIRRDFALFQFVTKIADKTERKSK